jgi:acyl-CoA synthetase (AMP-forming)/AMP-acid ligase II
MAGLSLLDRMNPFCEEDPQAVAIIDARGGVLSRTQWRERVRTLARGFLASGMEPGDRVLFAVRPDCEAMLIMVAIAEAGGVLVPLDPSMGPDLFRSRMEALSPRWVVAESVLYMATASRLIARLMGRLGVSIPPIAKLQHAQFVRVGPALPGVPGGLSIAAIEKLGATVRCVPETPCGEDPVMIVLTSGTTGAPKAVVHTWRSMWNVLDIVGKLLDAAPGDVVYARELHIILPAIYSGAVAVVPGRSRFKVKSFLAELEKYRVSHFFGVASELQQTVEYLTSRRQKLPESLREISIGAAPVRATFLQALQKVLTEGTSVWCVYGMTEILPVARVSLAEKVAFQAEGDLVGECVPGVSAGLTADGELVLRGPNLFSGYFGELPCEEHATGDLARLENGRIVLLGRKKDMIIRGKFNIYPELYEATIERIPCVGRCAMVGVYDDRREDERVILVVEAGADAKGEALQQMVRDALRRGPFRIDTEALPDEIIVMPLPMKGRSGKVDKSGLRDHVKRLRVI